MKTTGIDRRLQERLLLERRVEGDRLTLSDEVLRAALDGTRPLTAGERAALQASPLTTRRLRQLALERRAAEASGAWRGSEGLLRAADSGTLAGLGTDDGWWRLHFVQAAGAWRIIVQLVPEAPFAGALIEARAALRVVDGTGTVLLAGHLDADGECEAAWPCADDPAAHFQRRGARFAVEPGGEG